MTTTGKKALEGKVAIVTGGSRRIGRATALGLARHGVAVAVTARTAQGEIEAVAGEIRAMGGRALPLLVDVSDEVAVQGMTEAVAEEFGSIDILINNAAVRRQVPFLEMETAQWREILGVILDGAFFCARAVLPEMVKAGGGTIVNIGGLTAHTGAVNRAHVATAKAGLVGLTKALAVEFGGRGITVNCVAPGKIGGQRSATSGEVPAIPGGDAIPVGREGDVEEAAAMIVALCLPSARYMTGQTVHVNGGLYMP